MLSLVILAPSVFEISRRKQTNRQTRQTNKQTLIKTLPTWYSLCG